MGVGEFSALAAAALWATGSLLYSRIRLSAIAISFGKNVIASVILLLHLWLYAALTDATVFRADQTAWLWLGISGIAGIVIGDTFYFRSLQILGPRRALMISTTSPAFAAIGGWLFLSEVVQAVSAAGMTLTLCGVFGVIADRRASTEAPGIYPGSTSSGVVMGLLGAILSAAGAVTSRYGMADCDPLEAAFIRIFVSAFCGCLIVLATRQMRQTIRVILQTSVLKTFLPAVFCGTWLGIWMSQVAYKHSSVAVAMTLLSTTPVFAMPMVRIWYGVRITWFAVMATVLAITGIYLTVR